MEYQALYRKYRPKVFSDVIGQEHIVKTLKNQIAGGKISHAYLFCGTRGTGKTSTAKIFARAINCLNPKDGEPCMECEMCVADMEGRSVNVIEIDAASNRGIDSIKELREDIKYAPAEGTYKVYIIDEIHMLTTEAFNALLKTLEEPPKHVVFILATTDPQKIPATILSRCQRYDFKRITAEEITETIKKYLELEGINADEDAVKYVAYLGDGSMRDSLSILDQCLAYFSDEHITLEKILDVTGDVDISFYKDISDG
ncbi:MAG: DNA polymerase III subunit gamma/tau, partial [Firmicutes bacterium]|nr:DNA polymerase III subunit gamma/tau [Bacillota bacterium]